MNNKQQQEIITKIRYNKQIEEKSAWKAEDKYYCENEDIELINKYTKTNKQLSNEDFDEFYKELYTNLRNRYHNNFYPEVMDVENRIDYKLRGQPIINNLPLELIVKYSVKSTRTHITLDVDFITGKEENLFKNEKKYVENYQTEIIEEKKGILDGIKSFFQNKKEDNDVIDDEIIIPKFNKNFHKKEKKNTRKRPKKDQDNINKMFRICFDNYQFDSSIELLKYMNLSTKEYNALKYFLEFYKQWDTLNYNQTPDILVTFLETELITPLVKQFNKNKDAIRALRKENDYTFLVVDLINNARRRFEQELYNDSIIRLYRALELISHIKLLNEYDINPSNININKVREYNVPKSEIYHLKSLAKHNVTILGLKEQYRLLSLLHNPLGKYYYDNKEIFDEIVNMRNNSILIHGNTNISSLQYQQYEYMTIQLASIGIKNFQKYLKDSRFPKYNPNK